MAQYLVQSEHSKEECMQALDEIMDKNPELLEKYSFGCIAGEHIGWATINAQSESEAKEKLVPDFLREKAHVVEVAKFTPEQVRSFHEK